MKEKCRKSIISIVTITVVFNEPENLSASISTFTHCPAIANQAPRSAQALLLYNLHSLTDGRLRRLVQPVLSPRRSFGDLSEA